MDFANKSQSSYLQITAPEIFWTQLCKQTLSIKQSWNARWNTFAILDLIVNEFTGQKNVSVHSVPSTEPGPGGTLEDEVDVIPALMELTL